MRSVWPSLRRWGRRYRPWPIGSIASMGCDKRRSSRPVSALPTTAMQATGTPKSLDHKFFTEDVPTGLIPMSALGAAAGVRTPAIDALMQVARNMTAKDFVEEARTLERLGLSDMDGPQIRNVVHEGFPVSV